MSHEILLFYMFHSEIKNALLYSAIDCHPIVIMIILNILTVIDVLFFVSVVFMLLKYLKESEYVN